MSFSVAHWPATSLGPGLWYATRAAGLVAMLLLTATTALGLLTAGRLAGDRWPRFLVVGLHRNISLLALVFLGLHIGTNVAGQLRPLAFRTPSCRSCPGTTGSGSDSVRSRSDILIAVTVTSLLRQRIGHRFWRAVHWGGYLCWPVALAHGLGIGTDRSKTWVFYSGRLQSRRCWWPQ